MNKALIGVALVGAALAYDYFSNKKKNSSETNNSPVNDDENLTSGIDTAITPDNGDDNSPFNNDPDNNNNED